MVAFFSVCIHKTRALLLKFLTAKGASQVALVVTNPPANAGDGRDTGQSLIWEDPLEEEMATHSIILAWKIPWTEEPGGLKSTRLQKSQTQLNNKATTNLINNHLQQLMNC